MVTVTGLVPSATILAGETVMELPGAGLLTETLEAAEVPPPGVALTAVRASDPEEATSESDKVTLTCVLLTNAVARALPLTLITVVDTNPVPMTEMTGDVAPAATALGETLEMVGAGLSTSKFIGAPEPLLNEPFSTITESWPALAICVAVTVATNCLELT